MPYETSHAGLTDMDVCIRECTDCARVCLETIDHCLRLGGKHADPSHIKLLLDCAQTCQLSVELMSRDSNLAARMCGLCAVSCERCADDCERLADGDTAMQQCADVCRRCAASCRRMSAG